MAFERDIEAARSLGGARPDGVARWRTLSHSGVALPPPYGDLVPEGAGQVMWGGRPVTGLSPEARFFACEFVRRGGVVVDLGRGRREARLFGEHAPAARFWDDWKAMLPRTGCPITSLADSRLDLSRLAVVVPKKTHRVDEKTPAETARYATALVDGSPQPVAPSSVDRPGIFFGRPGSELTGRLRRRIVASDVTLNLGPNAPTPSVPSSDGVLRWGGVVRNPRIDWIARWRDPVTRIVKYARLSPASDGEQRASLERFEMAKSLRSRMRSFARVVSAAIASQDRRRKQLGVCLWLMWRLALRAGTGTPDEAAKNGAHGAANLLSKHVVVASGGRARLEFLGKDGVPYTRTLDSTASPADAPAVRALIKLAQHKRPPDPLFDRITSTDAASAISKTLSGATPKVLRTMRATEVFRTALDQVEHGWSKRAHSSSPPKESARAALVTAGALAAALCNHRKGKGAVDGAAVDLAAVERRINSEVLVPLSKGDETRGRALGRRLAAIVRESGLSLATSRANYIDPRVAFAFARKHGIPSGYSQALSKRFEWATGTK